LRSVEFLVLSLIVHESALRIFDATRVHVFGDFREFYFHAIG
jgi:hypothetical protein